MLIFSVNEAIALIGLIGLIMIAEVRLVKCKGTAGRQTANSSTIGCLLVPITVLDAKQKNLLLELLQLQRFKLQLFDIISPSQINNILI